MHAAHTRLSQTETAELAATLTRHVAGDIGRASDTRQSEDATAARPRVVADQFATLTHEQQRAIAGLVAALADQSRTRAKSLRAALRRFLERALTLEDLVFVGRQLTASLLRLARRERRGQGAPSDDAEPTT